MKNQFLLLIACLCFVHTAAAQEVILNAWGQGPTPPSLEGFTVTDSTQLPALLETLQQRDCYYTTQLSYAWPGTFTIPQRDSILALQDSLDERSIVYTCQILEYYGFPGKTLVGEASTHTMVFILLNEMESEEGKRYLPMLQAAVQEEELAPELLSLLIDSWQPANH